MVRKEVFIGRGKMISRNLKWKHSGWKTALIFDWVSWEWGQRCKQFRLQSWTFCSFPFETEKSINFRFGRGWRNSCKNDIAISEMNTHRQNHHMQAIVPGYLKQRKWTFRELHHLVQGDDLKIVNLVPRWHHMWHWHFALLITEGDTKGISEFNSSKFFISCDRGRCSDWLKTGKGLKNLRAPFSPRFSQSWTLWNGTKEFQSGNLVLLRFIWILQLFTARKLTVGKKF